MRWWAVCVGGVVGVVWGEEGWGRERVCDGGCEGGGGGGGGVRVWRKVGRGVGG